MYFYEVWVRSNHYHGDGALTYSSTEKLSIGQLINVPLKSEVVPAVVISLVSKTTIKTKDILSIAALPPLPLASLKLMTWLKKYYPGPVGTITQQFLPPIISAKTENVSHPLSKIEVDVKQLPKLNKEQLSAYQQMADNDTYLLHGRTGSGKTRLYIELAKDAVDDGRSVIILTPEISLTTQLEIQFRDVFGSRVVLIHSTLSPKQRYQRWSQLLMSPEPMIVIGPRSAIFSPMNNIGLIVIDEEHEPAYKQEQSPYYQTTKVASQLRIIHSAKLILGSATPLISDYYLAQSRNKLILRLNSLAKDNDQPPLVTQLVDCRDRSLFNRSSYLSQPLLEAIQSAIATKNQTLLYLNRRGTARVIICEECEWQAHCPKCNLPLTYHGDSHSLRCHTCGFVSTAPINCPQCSNPSIKYLSIGTKAVVDEVSRLFPQAKVQRFDADNLKADRIEQHYQTIKAGGVDIIIGTQMLAKGLDLPKLSVVGVLLADTSLQLPDYTVNERTFELLSQVIGRVGRGHVAGKAIIQTYQPNSELILSAIADNWAAFYNRELGERRQYNFPPFTHLLKLTIMRASAKNAETAALKLALTMPKDVKVEGPAPAFHEQQSGKYRWQLIIKASHRSSLLAIIEALPTNVSYNIDPADLM